MTLTVAQAAGSAADGIERVQAELRTLRHDATALHMAMDTAATSVVPDSTFNGPPMEVLIAERQLQPRLNTLVAQTNTVDQQLASGQGLLSSRWLRRQHFPIVNGCFRRPPFPS